MTANNDQLLDAISAALPPILEGLGTLARVGRHLHPPHLGTLATAVGNTAGPVREGLERFQHAAFPEHLEIFRDCVLRAGEGVCQACEGLEAAASGGEGIGGAYRAMGHHTRAMEALYPVAAMLPPVSRFFLEPGARDDAALLAKLANADVTRGEVGVIHVDNDKEDRGGFSLYVPEYYEPSRAHPLIVALHGGSGHGRDFLWTWLVAARTRGAILLSPTAQDKTWSLTGRDLDSAHISAMISRVGKSWNVDGRRLLLTGISDGGTFCYVSGLRNESPFTHLAPGAASFHPLLLYGSSEQRLGRLRIYLVHGVLDWMFSVDLARTANAALTEAGADVVYRELDDLSHTWPRDENPKIMDWFLA